MAETIASRVTSDKSERVDRDRLSSLPTWCSGISDNAGMTGPTSGAPAEPFSAKMIRKALDSHPDATVIVFPREDGQYSGLATDVLGLLERTTTEAGLLLSVPRLVSHERRWFEEHVLPLGSPEPARASQQALSPESCSKFSGPEAIPDPT